MLPLPCGSITRSSCFMLNNVPSTLVSKGRRVALGSLLRHGAGCAFRSSVIDCNIEASETADRLIHELTRVVIVADVSTNKNGFCSECLELGS
jgi:hypothetical protein